MSWKRCTNDTHKGTITDIRMIKKNTSGATSVGDDVTFQVYFSIQGKRCTLIPTRSNGKSVTYLALAIPNEHFELHFINGCHDSPLVVYGNIDGRNLVADVFGSNKLGIPPRQRITLRGFVDKYELYPFIFDDNDGSESLIRTIEFYVAKAYYMGTVPVPTDCNTASQTSNNVSQQNSKGSENIPTESGATQGTKMQIHKVPAKHVKIVCVDKNNYLKAMTEYNIKPAMLTYEEAQYLELVERIDSIDAKLVAKWTEREVAMFIGSLGYTLYPQLFLKHEINGERLLYLNSMLMQCMGISQEHSMLIDQHLHTVIKNRA